MNTIDATIKSVKSIMNDLRPATLELGLGPAAEWQLKQFERISGIACTLKVNSISPGFGLDEGRTSAIFRILQESLTNVARHAEASKIAITLRQDQFGFSMKVKDNGKGLQPGDRKKFNSFGLMGIKERIDALGGELVITSSPGKGTVLSIFVAT
jgi:signal transduction histidine kinase